MLCPDDRAQHFTYKYIMDRCIAGMIKGREENQWIKK